MTTTTITEHKMGICVEFGDSNNNKFWEYTLYDDGTAMIAFGRVGVTRTENHPTQAKALKKWGEKIRLSNKPDKLYTEIKAVDTGSTTVSVGSIKSAALKDVAKKQIKSNDPIVASLIDYLVQVNAHQILKQSGGKIQYDASSATFKTPLGVIAPDQVADARDLLVEIADLVAVNDFDNSEFAPTLNAYLRLIPHDVGMKKITPQRIFPDSQAVIAENDLLDGLDTSFINVTTSPKKKTTKKKADEPHIFDVKMEIVTDKKVISWARNLYQNTRKSMHASNNLSVKTVYKVDIKSMKSAYEKYGKKLSDIRQLWHGTKASNLLSIMRQGLIIPPSSSGHCTGRMYGNGLYFSSVSTKALNYATSYWGGGGSIDRTFMFLADVAMGKVHLAGGGWGSNYPVRGSNSTWAKGGSGGVMNDEMIVYRLDQANLIYLVEFCPRSNY